MRVLQRRISQTPTITIHPKLINHEEGTDNPKQIAPKEVDQHMIPPTLLEIVEDVPEGIFNDLKGGRSEEDEL